MGFIIWGTAFLIYGKIINEFLTKKEVLFASYEIS